MAIECYTTEYGFQYGAASVQREHRDEKRGFVQLGVRTPRSYIQVYVTKTGKIRVFGKKGAEMKEQTRTCETCRHWDDVSGMVCMRLHQVGVQLDARYDDYCSRHEAKNKQP